ncbi:MAG: ATP-binding cassette domain-containing protein, partial [Candidatus Brocadiales bacterium]
MKLLDIVGLTKIYGKRVVLNSLNLDVNSGEIIGLLGHNGAGKSTAFNSIIGITSPDGGRVIFRGKDITKLPIYKRARMGLGYLCQEPSVFQRLTVEENILAILEARKYNHGQRRKKSAQLMDDFGLTYLARKKAFVLSGGDHR